MSIRRNVSVGLDLMAFSNYILGYGYCFFNVFSEKWTNNMMANVGVYAHIFMPLFVERTEKPTAMTVK